MSALTIAVFSARSAETARSAASVFMEKSSETSAYEDGSNASCRIRLVLSVVASDWVGGQHRRGRRVEERRLTASRFSAWQQERLEDQTEKQRHRTSVVSALDTRIAPYNEFSRTARDPSPRRRT